MIRNAKYKVGNAQALLFTLFFLAAITGCGDPTTKKPSASADQPASVHKHAKDGETCYICDPALREKGRLWCKEHARYEDRCWLCHPDSRDKDRLFCEEHFLYEDECTICNPSLRAGKKTGAGGTAPDAKPAAGLFCKDHNVPEAECGICQPGLASSLEPGGSMKIRFGSRQSATRAGVRTALPSSSSSAPTVKAYCEVRYNENSLIRVTALTPGVVRRVAVDVGSQVKPGDVIAELDSPELARAKSAYLARLHVLELAQIDLDRSRTIHQNIKRALTLLNGEASIGDTNELSRMDLGLNRKDLFSTRAKWVAARSAFERSQKLIKGNIISRADFEVDEAAYLRAREEHHAVRDDLAFTCKRDLDAKMREHKAARFGLESARRGLFTLGLDGPQVEAIPEEQGERLARLAVRAPGDGTVVVRSAVVGEAIEPGQPLVSTADLSSMWLSLTMPPGYAVHIKPGMGVEAEFSALPGSVVKGELVWVDTTIDERTRLVGARAVVPNRTGTLKVGMFGEARIVISQSTQGLRVPKAAVMELDKHPYVFLKLEDDLYALRRVALGNRTDGWVNIVAGLRPDEPVVVVGSFIVMSEFLKSRLGAGCVDD